MGQIVAHALHIGLNATLNRRTTRCYEPKQHSRGDGSNRAGPKQLVPTLVCVRLRRSDFPKIVPKYAHGDETDHYDLCQQSPRHLALEEIRQDRNRIAD